MYGGWHFAQCCQGSRWPHDKGAKLMEIDPNHWFGLQLLEINLVLDKSLRINGYIYPWIIE